ncbi:MAG: energy-coupling factor transporter transmembrane component T [Actinomycetota bacterium]|nr:energy-coupling factor transporter transmembrane protein EcfT [Actinomycetota bacterium]MDA8117042.1 energy-coupling factor transporter transmembrane component T [Actinomycetota bacterium]
MPSLSSYVPRESLVHGLHPVTKLVYVACILALAVVYSTPAPLVVLLLATCCVLLAARVLRPAVRIMSRTVLLIALFLFVVRGLAEPGGNVAFALGPLAFKQAGLDVAMLISLRLFIFVAAALTLLLTTYPPYLMAALEEKKLSPRASYVVLSTMQIIPMMQARATAILEAQQARGLDTRGSLLTRVRALFALVGPLVLGSIEGVEARAMAIEARAFLVHHRRTHLYAVATSSVDRVLMVALPVLTFAFATLRFLVR